MNIPSGPASDAWRPRVERLLASLTIFNGLLGLAAWLCVGQAHSVLPLLSLLALLAGVLAWRGSRSWHFLALAAYGPQLAGYYSYDLSYVYKPGSAFSLAVVAHLSTGVLVINVFALAMFAASAALFWWRARGGGKAYSTYQ